MLILLGSKGWVTEGSPEESGFEQEILLHRPPRGVHEICIAEVDCFQNSCWLSQGKPRKSSNSNNG